MFTYYDAIFCTSLNFTGILHICVLNIYIYIIFFLHVISDESFLFICNACVFLFSVCNTLQLIRFSCSPFTVRNVFYFSSSSSHAIDLFPRSLFTQRSCRPQDVACLPIEHNMAECSFIYFPRDIRYVV